jgi:hypothetical protein
MRRACTAISCFVAAAAWLGLAIPSVAGTPRPAPAFSYDAVGGKKTLRNLRGQPVVLVVSKSPKTRAFRKQLKALKPIYQEFASRNVVFVAAFSEADGEVPSNIPFVIANNGPGTAAAYDLQDDIIVAIIGKDGNLDLITDKVLPAFRIREVIQNSFEVQNAARKETPKGPPVR